MEIHRGVESFSEQMGQRRKSKTTRVNISDSQVKLIPALVPASLWGRSVYNALRQTGRRKEWETLRLKILEGSANKCHYCATYYERHMVCHEVWEYADDKRIATLTTLVIACRNCNFVLHMGKASLIAEKYGTTEQMDKQILKQLRTVNRISKKEAEYLIEEAAMLFVIRSPRKWRVRIASDLIRQHPVLSGLKL